MPPHPGSPTCSSRRGRDNSGIVSGGRTGTVEPDAGGGLDLTITEQFARSMSLDDALNPRNLLCYEAPANRVLTPNQIYAVTKDRQRFLVNATSRQSNGGAPLTVVLNWTAVLHR